MKDKKQINKAIDVQQILNQLLTSIKPINFENSVKNNDDTAQTLKQKHYIIVSIDEIVKRIRKNGLDLTTKDELTYMYNGSYWEVLERSILKIFLSEAAVKMGTPFYDAKYFDFKDRLHKQFQSSVTIPTKEIQKDNVKINLQNGTFEIDVNGKTKLRTFNKKDFLTYQLSFSYDPDATAPIFQKYLDRVLPEKESQMILAEFLGYIFIGNGSKTFKEEKALILFGSGANGKSVFFEIVMALLGYENISNYSLESLTNSSGYQRAGLRGKLLNYASEISPKLDPSLFKQLISGEPIECRLPYGNPFILRDYAKFMFNSNVLPKDIENTAAYFRRFLIVPFLEEIPPEEQDKNLHNKIIDKELSGVFNWVLSGLERILKNQKFTESPLVEKTIENFKTDSDSVKLFLKENNYTKSATVHIKIKDLYNQYRTFCLEDGYKPVNKNNFIKRLKNSGYIIQRINIGNVAFIQLNLNTLKL